MGRNKIDLSNADWSKPIQKIADEIGCSYATVYLHAKTNGIKTVNRQSKFRVLLESAKTWDWMNKDLGALAAENGISYAMCGLIQRQLGVKAKRKPVKGSENSIAASVKDEEIRSMIDADIAHRYNCSRELIRQIRKKRGIDGPRQRMQKIDPSALELPTKEAAEKYGRSVAWVYKKRSIAGIKVKRSHTGFRPPEGFNWSRKVSDIAAEIGCSYVHAVNLRVKFAPDLVKKRKRKREGVQQ